MMAAISQDCNRGLCRACDARWCDHACHESQPPAPFDQCTCGHDVLGPEWHVTGCPQGAATDRELLAHAIWTTGRTRAVDRFPLADALMPVVEAIARRRAAVELRTVAANYVTRQADRELIRARADDLTDTEETL